jgi:hypothetical protein
MVEENSKINKGFGFLVRSYFDTGSGLLELDFFTQK